MAINYGCDKVRFVSPVPVDSRVRGGAAIESVTDVAGGIQVKFVVTIEIEGQEKPACVVEALLRWYV